MWHALVGQASGPPIPVFGEQEILFREEKNHTHKPNFCALFPAKSPSIHIYGMGH